MKVTEEIVYVGVNDHELDLFEGQYAVPAGMAYNSYVICDEKTAVMDSVDTHFAEEWLNHIDQTLGGKAPDYIVIQHMEPDHSGSLVAFAKKYPQTTIVTSAKALVMMQQFFGEDFWPQPGGEREGYPYPGTAHTAFRRCTHGTLAGGAHDLR